MPEWKHGDLPSRKETHEPDDNLRGIYDAAADSKIGRCIGQLSKSLLSVNDIYGFRFITCYMSAPNLLKRGTKDSFKLAVGIGCR